MRKYLQLLSLMLCMMAGAMVFAACGDDDDDDVNPDNQKADSSITVQDIIGDWYGIDENTSEKVNVFVLFLEQGGHGMYGEIKAKAKNDWEPEEQSVEMSWVLEKGVLTMSFETPDGQETRVGEIVKKNSDGSLQVRRQLGEGKTDVITINRLNDRQSFWQLVEELISSKL